jgi:septum formation protein
MKLILASQSPRRRELLTEHGYEFEVVPPRDGAECGICSRETPPEMVARLAWQKAKDVAERVAGPAIVIGCDTAAECCGLILGKPKNLEHARDMLQLLRGRDHAVYSGLCLWHVPSNEHHVMVDVTRLRMDAIAEDQIEDYLTSNQWEGKAGAFGYQDRLGWIHIVEGSESNVVGLPMELLGRMLAS